MLDQESINQQLDLLATHRRTLVHLIEQAAQFGGEVFAPPQTVNGIAEARQQIRRIKAVLRENSIQIEDGANDEPHVPAVYLPLDANLASSPRPLRVFLCHASRDKPEVYKLYRKLQTDGFEPWLDNEDILPGQDWRKEIPKAVRAADVVLVCLSREAINKQGYIRQEIEFALDAADNQPAGTIYLIPLKLKACTVPERLSRWQWVNLFERDGYERLTRALRIRASVLGLSVIPGALSQGLLPLPLKTQVPQVNRLGTTGDRSRSSSIISRLKKTSLRHWTLPVVNLSTWLRNRFIILFSPINRKVGFILIGVAALAVLLLSLSSQINKLTVGAGVTTNTAMSVGQLTSPILPIVPRRSPGATMVSTSTSVPTTSPVLVGVGVPTALLSTPTHIAHLSPTTNVPTVIPTLVPDATVNNASLNMRSGPGTSYSIEGSYSQGTPLTVIGKETSGEWLQVKTSDGHSGWMLMARLKVNRDLSSVAMIKAPATSTIQPIAQTNAQATYQAQTARVISGSQAIPTSTVAPTAQATVVATPTPTVDAEEIAFVKSLDGFWEGTTSQPGGGISFLVKDGEIYQIGLKYFCPQREGGMGLAGFGNIVDRRFDSRRSPYNFNEISVVGEFTSSTSASGQWDMLRLNDAGGPYCLVSLSRKLS